MTTLGKVILFLNVGAAAAVAYFATGVWAKRQSLNAVGLRYAVTLKGLPTEPQPGQPAKLESAGDDETSVAITLPTGTGRFVDEIPLRILKAQFTGAEGAKFGDPLPPLSVKGELERAKVKVDLFFAENKPADVRLANLCGSFTINKDGNPISFNPGILAELAESIEERRHLKRLANPIDTDPQQRAIKVAENAKTAKKMLDKRFEAVIRSPNPSEADADAARIDAARVTLTAVRDALRAAVQAETEKRAELDAALAALKADEFNPAKNNAVVNLRLEYATENGKVGAARAALTAATAAFDLALTDTGLAASRSDGDRRRRACLLLMHLDPTDAAWQKRLILLFGQPEYLAAQSDRIERLAPLPSLADREREAADRKFGEEYEQLKQWAKDRVRLLDRQVELLDEAKKQAFDADKIANDRVAYGEKRKELRDGFEVQVRALAAEQEKVEGELFDIQQRVGRLLRENFELEDRLIAVEKIALPTGR